MSLFFVLICIFNCSICYNTDNWKLMSKYSKRFVEAGVKLRRSAFDVWMEFAAKIGLYKFSDLLNCVASCLLSSHPLISQPSTSYLFFFNLFFYFLFKLIFAYDDFQYVVKAFQLSHCRRCWILMGNWEVEIWVSEAAHCCEWIFMCKGTESSIVTFSSIIRIVKTKLTYKWGP